MIVGALLAVTLGQAIEAKPEQLLLYTGCRKVGVVVASGGQRVAGMPGEEAQEAMLESRLRTARLYAADATDLYLGVSIEGNPISSFDGAYRFDLAVDFRRLVQNPSRPDDIGWATVWSRGGTGDWYRADPKPMFREAVEGILDEFIRDYLRVNESACP